MLKKEEYLGFNDVLIKASVSELDSRSQVSLRKTGKWNPIPVVSANMDTVTGPELAFELIKRGWVAVLHKYVSIEEISELFNKIDEYNKKETEKIDYRNLFISRGTTEADKIKLKERLVTEKRIMSVCIDVANGHRLSAVEYARELKEGICKNKILMFGNIGTEEMVPFYEDAGVDIIKIGIGPGCFKGNTHIETKNGFKKIKDVEIGEEVRTHKNRFRKVKGRSVYKEKDKMININGEFSTVDHKYYVILGTDEQRVNENNLEDIAMWFKAADINKRYKLVSYGEKGLEFKDIEICREEEYIGEVYDIEVEEDHSFCLRNAVVHNSACITRVKTGVGTPQVSLIDKCVKKRKKAFICSDGGCKTEGDIAKAFAAGADFVMIGGMLAGYKETPGTIEVMGERRFKRFSGMAAKESQHTGVPNHGTEEGKTIMIPYKGKVYHKLIDIEGGLRSACTYVNARNIEELKNAELIITREQENKVFN